MRIPIILTILPPLVLCACPAMAGSKDNESQFGATGLLGEAGRGAITVTKVEKGSPADGRIRVGDSIIGVGKGKFGKDIRRDFADAIDEAETEEAGGKLTLILKGDQTVELQLKVMGRYSDSAPYHCPKTDAIIRQAADHLARSTQTKGKSPQINAAMGGLETGWLGLMATGEPEYIDIVKRNLPLQDWAKPNRDDLMAVVKGDKDAGYVGWYWGYRLITLAEYHLLTGDKTVLPAIEGYAEALAMGQDAVGLWSHRMAIWNKNNGRPHGRCIGYGQMNQPSLVCFMGMLLAKKCGVKSAEVDAAILRSHEYFNSFTGRGTFPYGVHDPFSRDFNNNGMSATAALCMAFHGNRESAAFFSRCSAAAHDRLEQGHATYYFNVLWTPLGANVAGPEVTKRFFKESRWLQTLYRTWDGRFTHDGGESREGNSTGAHLLAYCLPRRALYITGKVADESLWLKDAEAADTIGLSRIQYDRKSADELLECFGSPFPQVAIPAVEALRKKPGDFSGKLSKLMQTGTKAEKLGAIRYFGSGCANAVALPQLDRLGAILRDDKENPEVRAAAAGSLACLGEPAYRYYDDMLKLILADEPGDTFRATDESLARSINSLCGNPYAAGLVKDKKLFYGAALKLMDHKRQNTRAEGLRMVAAMPLEDFCYVADKIEYILADKDLTYHSYHNQSARGEAISVLINLNIAEGLQYLPETLDSDTGKASFKIKMLINTLPKYGGNAKTVLEKLKADPRFANVESNKKFAKSWKEMVAKIESDDHPPKLITMEEAKTYSGKKPNSK